jgi:hypothetical protein
VALDRPEYRDGRGDDFGFEAVFARQVEALGRAGDLAVGITTSGNSPNVVRGSKRRRPGGCGRSRSRETMAARQGGLPRCT